MSHESTPWPPELVAFLGRFGIREEARLGPFRLARATLSGRVVGLELAQGRHSFVAYLSALDPSIPSFSRTASFNVSYAKVAPPLERVVGQVMHALVRVIAARDPGGLSIPTPASRRVRAADFRVAYVDADQLAAYPDAMHDMFERRMDAMILRDVFSREQAAAIVAELERPGARYPWKENVQSDHVDHAQPYTLGEVLIPSRRLPDGPELGTYFDEAAALRRTVEQLFAGGRPFEARIEEVLSRVAGGRPVALPRGPAGQPYTPATVRALPTGGELALHVGNYFKDHSTYQHLRTFVDLEDQLSYFVTLAAPDAGGEIEVYTLEWADAERPLNALGEIDAAAVMEGWPSATFKPGPGDMFLFDGGRYYHRVRPTEGPRTRWTIGGFVTISRDHERYFYWS